ncbi:MAG TPA: hypothetical protein VNI58_03310 [Mariprofundaceae bacterium]|nr:hypothetical protein [Mariprofundaceae bacterium]
MTSDMNEITELWDQFRNAPFPRELGGEEIDGVELVLLDADAAAVVSTFIGKSGKISEQQIQLLEGYVKDASQVLPKLNGEGMHYFALLLKLCDLVLNQAKNLRPE